MKSRLHICIAFVGLGSALVSVSRADQAEDDAAIRKNAEAYVAAYNDHDAKALAAL